MRNLLVHIRQEQDQKQAETDAILTEPICLHEIKYVWLAKSVTEELAVPCPICLGDGEVSRCNDLMTDEERDVLHNSDRSKWHTCPRCEGRGEIYRELS